MLDAIDGYSSTNPFKHEMMNFGYVLVCGAIEFMTENILQEWLNKTIQHHGHSSAYRGKKYVQYFLSMQSQAKEDSIKKFHSTDLNQTRELIKNIAGVAARDKFNQLLQQSTVIQPDINARLERINRFRHDLAHGQKMPRDTQPNVVELKEDFLFVYKHIIKNIMRCLPRV